MTGFVGGIQRFSTSDGPGIRTTVFLKGCPLNCQWCHNPELISPHQQLMRSITKCIGCGACHSVCPQKAIQLGTDVYFVNWELCDDCLSCVEVCTAQAMQAAGSHQSPEQVFELVLRDKGFYDKSGGGLTISGGELLLQPAFADQLLELAKYHGISVALDTSGYGRTEDLFRLARRADWLLYDIKCIDDACHRAYTGVSNRVILNHLCGLAEDPDLRKKILVRMPLIHNINDTPEIICRTVEFCRDHGLQSVTLLPYHQLGISKSRGIGRPTQTFEPPSADRMQEIQTAFQKAGISAEILGSDIR